MPVELRYRYRPMPPHRKCAIAIRPNEGLATFRPGLVGGAEIVGKLTRQYIDARCCVQTGRSLVESLWFYWIGERAMAKPYRRTLGFLFAFFCLDLSSGVCSDIADEGLSSEKLYWQRLDEIRSEKNYPVDVTRGTYKSSHKLEGFEYTFHYIVDVPETYDPAQSMDLHIYLHGGVGMSANRISKRKMRRLERLRVGGAISVYPSASSSAKWWYESQTKNIVQIIKTVKESYNIDDNRVFLHGLSDGAGGAYYFASHLPTPFAGFIALIGSPHVLRSSNRVFGTTFPGNFINKPIFALNTKDDHLFPAKSVEDLFERVNNSGGDITFYAERGDHFSMRWLGARKKDYESFVAKNSRNPYPDFLYWQIDVGGEFDRIHWLIVNGTQGGDTKSAVLANKIGNAVHLSSYNVSAVTLLISSDHFDLSKNIQVWLNQVLVIDQKVSPDISVLDKWFKLDQDRSMLFAGEIYLDALLELGLE